MATELRASIGSAVRQARLDRGWTQGELGRAGRTSRSMVAAVEAGSRAASLETLARLARALDAALVVEVRPALTLGRSDQRDAAHAACVAAVRRRLQRLGLECAVEIPIIDGRLRGWIDLIGFDREIGRLVVVEVKTELRDLGGLQRQIGWYARAAPGAAESIGWRVTTLGVLAAFLATTENDERLAAQKETISRAFPVRGRALDAALAGAPWRGWGIAMIDPRRRGSRSWTGLRIDGRRTPAPYASYADFMQTLRSAAPRAPARRARRG